MPTDQTQTAVDVRPFVIPPDDDGLPSFEAFFKATYGAIPAALLARLAELPSPVAMAMSDHADRLAGTFGYLTVGLAEQIVRSYADPDQMLAIFTRELTDAIAAAKEEYA